ncbi:MAG: aminodeoxychorismate synthase component I [Cellvibrionaceae bacterium]|nr:aminodeoxychorismate synthase component I [Cellvibrionaceae bacterium]
MRRSDFPYAANAESLFLQLSHLPGCVWLDSGKPESNLGRYDILTAFPSEQIRGDCDTVNERIKERLRSTTSQLSSTKGDSELPFCGGWIGFYSYSCRHTAFRLKGKPSPIPEAQFSWYDWALVIDHQERKAELIWLGTCTAEVRKKVLEALQTSPDTGTYSCSEFATDESREHYLAAIGKITAYLLAGDCYQVNYTQRFSADFHGSTPAAYLSLRRAVPSPFSAFLTLQEGSVMSISPERFIQINQRQALSQPIKGTAPRGKSHQEDDELRDTLRNSEKNQAENLMIVDLLRNDFSISCLPHSVEVPQLFALQSFNNVHHLVSDITGTLNPDVSHPDFIAACFPGGSITGAPKKRAMEVIEELEQHSRSIYCGAIGYFSVNGKTDFNIAIRTLLQHNQKLYAWAGGGIVADSDPAQEYEESLHKIGSLLRALVAGSAERQTD